MMNLKCLRNNVTICVFGIVDDVNVHIANISTVTNKIYTTLSGYELLATESFKKLHEALPFDDDKPTEQTDYRKFDISVHFDKSELNRVIGMCSRKLEF
jgi:hypothetical protein